MTKGRHASKMFKTVRNQLQKILNCAMSCRIGHLVTLQMCVCLCVFHRYCVLRNKNNFVILLCVFFAFLTLLLLHECCFCCLYLHWNFFVCVEKSLSSHLLKDILNSHSVSQAASQPASEQTNIRIHKYHLPSSSSQTKCADSRDLFWSKKKNMSRYYFVLMFCTKTDARAHTQKEREKEPWHVLGSLTLRIQS